MVLKMTFSHIYVDVRRVRLKDVGSRHESFAYESGFKRIVPTGEPIFVAASHQTGLDTRSMTRRSVIVGVLQRGRSGTSRGSSLGDYDASSPSGGAPPETGSLTASSLPLLNRAS